MSLDLLPQSKQRKTDPDSPQWLTLDHRSLPTEDRAVDIEMKDSKFPAFLRQSSAGRTTDWFQTSFTGEYILYNRTGSKQSEFQWFEIWIAHWAKQHKLDLKRRRLSADSSIYRFWFYTVSEILSIELVRIGLVAKLPKRTLSSLAAAAYPNLHFE